MRRLPALLLALALALAATSACVPVAHALRSLLVAALLTTPDVSLWALPRAHGALALFILLAPLILLILPARVVLARVGEVLGFVLVYYCAPLALRRREQNSEEVR